ncbi:hypothetical protein Ahy_B10g104864 [Arachis hypogaea]|uniref:Uncharacterized protein n=1 Tax=Arachis hypogaea TaxID=3818 RepID=A0A444X6Y9_ARAHY|nr:hypothetical protein Ahy_B10g104864 [Arachis hypogaea]
MEFFQDSRFWLGRALECLCVGAVIHPQTNCGGLRQSAFILMRELSWRFFGHKIDCRRLFLLAAISLSLMIVHRYLLNDKSPYENDLSHPSLNSSTTKETSAVVQSVAFESKRAETCLNSSISRSKREDKLANATKNTRFFFPLGVPSYKQKHIQLLPPHEALVYAKKEIDNTPLVNEGLDLYAPSGAGNG